MTKNYLFLMLLLSMNAAFAQVSDVADISFKIEGKKEKVFHYAFAQGDEITFSFNETSGKKVTLSFGEYNKSPKYQEYEISEVKGKVFNIQYTRVYEFKFLNEEGKEKVCKMLISRKAQEATANFNTQVQWKEVYDTIFDVKKDVVTTGYRTVQKQKSRRVLASTDTTVTPLIDKIERVPWNGASFIQFQIPQPVSEPIIYPMKETKVISWAYTLACDKEGDSWLQKANSKAGSELLKKAAMLAGIDPGTYALAALAIKGILILAPPAEGKNVQFSLSFGQNGQWNAMRTGNSVVHTEQMVEIYPGYYGINMTNNKTVGGLNVKVQVLIVQKTDNYKIEYYTVTDQEPVKEQRTIKIPKKINMTKRPVMESTN